MCRINCIKLTVDMKKFIGFIIAIILIQAYCLESLKAYSTYRKPDGSVIDMNKILSSYINTKEPDFKWVIESKYKDDFKIGSKFQKVSRYNLKLTSLRWRQGERDAVDHPVWEHSLVVYIPEKVLRDTALLYVNNGTRHHPKHSSVIIEDNSLDFSGIAARTQSIVVDLKDVPNQFLRLAGGDPLSGDVLIAYTWERFMKNPEANADWPLQLPMVKSVIKAMDAVQGLMKQERLEIKNFVVSGASKRGWVAWLAAAFDERVTAVIPLVADFVNLPEMVRHLFKVYSHGNPAISPYMSLRSRIGTKPMDALFSVVDPYQYRQKLTKPKFVVSASGDNFVPSDTARFFFSELPGKKWMRVLPNRSHYIFKGNLAQVSNIVESYYSVFINGGVLPELTWEYVQGKLKVSSSIAPKTVKLWQASNAVARDFRKSMDNSNVSEFVSTQINLTPGNARELVINLPDPKKGWRASFVELSYANAPYDDLVFTTRLFVTPDSYPETEVSSFNVSTE